MAISKVNSPYTKIQDVPDVPTIGTATEGEESAEVAFTPATTGGRAYQYRALSSPGSIEAVGSSSPITVPGLTADTTYSFQVRAETNTGATNGYSSASNSVVPTALGEYELLETEILLSDTASVTFDNLDTVAADYKHLQIRYSVRSTQSSSFGWEWTQFKINGSGLTGGHELRAMSGSVTSAHNSGNSYMTPMPNSNQPTGVFSGGVLNILDFSSTTKNTTLRALGGQSGSINPVIVSSSGLFASTSAVTSITADSQVGANFAAGSRFSLYGLKVA